MDRYELAEAIEKAVKASAWEHARLDFFETAEGGTGVHFLDPPPGSERQVLLNIMKLLENIKAIPGAEIRSIGMRGGSNSDISIGVRVGNLFNCIRITTDR